MDATIFKSPFAKTTKPKVLIIKFTNTPLNEIIIFLYNSSPSYSCSKGITEPPTGINLKLNSASLIKKCNIVFPTPIS
ncbi:hypothetical protein D3C81_1196080 [compost metagenome]